MISRGTTLTRRSLGPKSRSGAETTIYSIKHPTSPSSFGVRALRETGVGCFLWREKKERGKEGERERERQYYIQKREGEREKKKNKTQHQLFF
jgi:hypothetical protein